MVTNICVVGLLNNYTKEITQQVANVLEMFYTDVTEVLEYDLVDLARAEDLVGKEYIAKQETGTIRMLSSYENTIYTINYASLNMEHNLDSVKEGCVLVYLRLDETSFNDKLKTSKLPKTESSLLKKQFKNRDLILTDIADVVADVSKSNNEIEIILKKIEEYYEKR